MKNYDAFKGVPIPVKDAVAYSDGSVVSKTILDAPAGTLTFFAFGEGEGLSEHTAPYDATVHILDGEAQIIIDGNPIVVKSGELIIMPANIRHELRAVKPFKMLLIMIREKQAATQ
jgi:quercetin dioxygenase-like cupin family protein